MDTNLGGCYLVGQPMGAAVFLTSADSDSMTGQTLQVDGGRAIG